MGSPRDQGPASKHIDQERLSPSSSALEENVQAIKRWERTILLARSKAEQVSVGMRGTVAVGPVLVLHVRWFGV